MFSHYENKFCLLFSNGGRNGTGRTCWRTCPATRQAARWLVETTGTSARHERSPPTTVCTLPPSTVRRPTRAAPTWRSTASSKTSKRSRCVKASSLMLPAWCAEQGLCNGRASVRPSVPAIDTSNDGRRAAERRRLQQISTNSCGRSAAAPALSSECG